MRCEVCLAGLKDGATLIRQNPKGEAGIWKCLGCNRKPVAQELDEILSILGNDPKS